MLTLLPAELLTTVLNLLDVPSVVICSGICRSLRNLITESVSLQYDIALYVASFVDGPPSNMVKSVRLKTLRDHQRAWNELKWPSVQEINFLEPSWMDSDNSSWEVQLVGGVFRINFESRLRFIQLPSILCGIPMKEWEIPDIGFRAHQFVEDYSQNLIVGVEEVLNLCVAT